MTATDKIIGIDLGTTNSVLAITAEGIPTIYPVGGSNLLPSVVGITSTNEMLVGKTAQNQWTAAPERTIRSIKRRMGSDETVSLGSATYTPQEISAIILREIKQAAEGHLGATVERAVITVPAYFNVVQRQATMEAGAIAGLTVERIINEPTAAALAYGFGINDDEHNRILVYDLGGGTFDVSIIELNYGVVDVMATAGDNYLGGDDFDERLAELIAEEFVEEHKIDLHNSPRSWSRLLQAAEAAKIELSNEPTTTIDLEFIAEDTNGNPLHISRTVDRQEFIHRIQDLLDSTLACIQNALTDAQLEPDEIDRVLLVGGSTRIPAVWDLVAEHMGKSPHAEIDPDAAVALGAAVQAGIVAGEEIDSILVDVTPLSLGIETATMGLTGQIQADHFSPLIRRNTTIPVQKSEMFSTMFPGQESVQVKVYQGESQSASKNVLLGDFMFEDLEPSFDSEDGRAVVHVNFKLDINGILDVTVTDQVSGNQVSEQMKASRQRLSPEELAASQARLAEAGASQSSTSQATSIDGVATPSIDGLSAPHSGATTEDKDGIDAGTQALLNQAQALLDDPDTDGVLKALMTSAVADIRAAAQAGDAEKMEEKSDELIDLLMEAEE